MWWTKVVVALCLAMTLSANALRAQQRREKVRVLFALAPGQDQDHLTVAVRLVNVSEHEINVWMPTRLSCHKTPGSIFLQWRYIGDKASAATAALAFQTACVDDAPRRDADGSSSSLQPLHRWMHFAPGQYIDVTDTIAIAYLKGFRFELRAVYTAPVYSYVERDELKTVGVDTLKGEYQSEPFPFVIQ